jgi:hypothetical protein
MNGEKVNKFMQLAGQQTSSDFRAGSPKERALGAQLLLSEVLEYVIKGLGVTPVVNGTKIEDPNGLEYLPSSEVVDEEESIDGLADVAYTMYWNAEAFGIPLEEAYDLVCDNNIEKFVKLDKWTHGTGSIAQELWHCELEIQWPEEVVEVEVLDVSGEKYAAGKDCNGKVRKPCHFKPVDLSPLLSRAA